MSKSHISKELRERIAEQAGRRCGYCLTSEAIVGSPMEIDHLIPEALGGSSDEDNLWLACSHCNDIKSVRIVGADPDSGLVVRYYDPRRQKWSEHFEWSADGTHVIGKSPTGRATVAGLRLNRPVLVAARRCWVAVSWHPPKTGRES